MGYKFQFVTLAGFHSLNYGMFELSHGYSKRGMAAYSELQQREFGSEKLGYTATKCAPSCPPASTECLAQLSNAKACAAGIAPRALRPN